MSLLVSGVLTDNTDTSLALDYLALLANRFNGSSNLHLKLLLSSFLVICRHLIIVIDHKKVQQIYYNTAYINLQADFYKLFPIYIVDSQFFICVFMLFS